MKVPQLDFTPTVPILLRRALRRHRDQCLVVTAEERLTFAAAEARSAKLAKALVGAGIGKGTRVALMLPSGPAWVIAWLALARIGAMSMLFSTTYRSSEIANALRTGDVQHLITCGELFGRNLGQEIERAVPGIENQRAGQYRLSSTPYLRQVWLTGSQSRPWAHPLDLACPERGLDPGMSDDFLRSLEDRVTPADVLTVIYTSGSSAEPKAVMHSQGAAVRKVAPQAGLGLASSKPGVVFMAMPLFWVGGPQSLLGALHSGSTMLCQQKFDAEGALELIERERATRISGWASMLETLRGHPSYASRDLRSIVSPPPPPPPGTPGASPSLRGHPLNLGMTETFGPHGDRAYFDYKVIDRESGQILEDGEEGEFCVRGFGLTVGIYGRERQDVFDEDGYYHTGDRGYIEGGSIYFTGRYSEMIKTGGANVAPLEVEATLLRLEGIEQAYVFGLPDPSLGEVVSAVLVPADGARCDPVEIQEHMKDRLSAYKIPRRFHVITAREVPLLGSGKPDKRSLRQWALQQGDSALAHPLSAPTIELRNEIPAFPRAKARVVVPDS